MNIIFRIQKYEKEQRNLTVEVENAKVELQSAEQKTVDLRLLLKTIREITEVKEVSLVGTQTEPMLQQGTFATAYIPIFFYPVANAATLWYIQYRDIICGIL